MPDAIIYTVEKDFEFLNHTADIGIIAYGDDLPEAFVNAARGMMSIIAEPEEIEARRVKNIEVAAPDREALLVNWLNELVYIIDAEQVLFKTFEISSLTDTALKAIARGEKIDTGKHHIKIQVKAATYHKLKIEETTEGWRAQVIFDV